MKVQAKHCNLQDLIFKQLYILRDISFYALSLNKSPTHGVLFVSFSYSSKMKFFNTSIAFNKPGEAKILVKSLAILFSHQLIYKGLGARNRVKNLLRVYIVLKFFFSSFLLWVISNTWSSNHILLKPWKQN